MFSAYASSLLYVKLVLGPIGRSTVVYTLSCFAAEAEAATYKLPRNCCNYIGFLL